MSELQLTIDGREVPMAQVNRFRPLTDAQRVILLTIAVEGQIRSADAGRILHAQDERPNAVERRARYAGSDGWSCLRRMEQRGLVRKVARGVWQAANR